MDKKLLSLYGLKFNPFAQHIPTEALWLTPGLENFCWRVEQQLGHGGFALAIGNPGSGKSAGLRYLATRLGAMRDVVVGVLSRPQATLPDFYRELGDMFGVAISPHNRWSCAKLLREKWRSQIDTSLCRPVVLMDEAQEACPALLRELRILASSELDSRFILSVILAGDNRLVAKLDSPELSPLASRIRIRLRCEELNVQQLHDCLNHVMDVAGAPRLMSMVLRQTLCEHAAGNLRLLMNMSDELLSEACKRELNTIDEKLYFEVFASPRTATSKQKAAA